VSLSRILGRAGFVSVVIVIFKALRFSFCPSLDWLLTFFLMSISAPDLLDDLQWRGLLADCTDLNGLRDRLASGRPLSLYCGFDPTGNSLHVGHLVPQLTLRRFQIAGHHPITLAGGATGMIGDPGGKSAERNLLTREQLAHNVACIKGQLALLLDFKTPTNPARLVDNADWTAPLSFLDFLRDIGKYFSLANMIAKDSVKSRLESETGISYTEFSYQLLQAFDFCHLRQHHDCELQIGGTEQWGNITAGTDLIRKKLGFDVTAWGLTLPLVLKADGTKFGKTEGGAVWLDPAKTSAYKFFQFFVNTEDSKVIEYLKKFTFLPRAEIEALSAQHAAAPGERIAHKALARTVTALIHGQPALDSVLQATEILFGGTIDRTDSTSFNHLVGEVPTLEVPHLRLAPPGLALTEALVFTGLETSKGNARKSIEGGGIYVNNIKCDPTQPSSVLTVSDLLFGRYLLLRKGKKSYTLLVFV
jgi:tyrosyl-tRNA synthetase